MNHPAGSKSSELLFFSTNRFSPLDKCEIVVRGTVGKTDKNVLVANAQNVFVETGRE
ncbi:MAG TPA: hypothetical protein VMC85_23540 [Desulfomonilaceae bacterium]|nr:hypothetical protein [Desulfomonilaceae bacterium]